jgi:hypothetical protein
MANYKTMSKIKHLEKTVYMRAGDEDQLKRLSIFLRLRDSSLKAPINLAILIVERANVDVDKLENPQEFEGNATGSGLRNSLIRGRVAFTRLRIKGRDYPESFVPFIPFLRWLVP